MAEIRRSARALARSPGGALGATLGGHVGSSSIAGGDLYMLVPSPKWLDTGDNAWQLAAATFVGLQSIPGLVVLYGGVVKKKWAINSAFMAVYAFASVLVVWVL